MEARLRFQVRLAKSEGHGHEDCLPIYQFYHVLNHLNLFGGGYFGQSKRILQHYTGG